MKNATLCAFLVLAIFTSCSEPDSPAPTQECTDVLTIENLRVSTYPGYDTPCDYQTFTNLVFTCEKSVLLYRGSRLERVGEAGNPTRYLWADNNGHTKEVLFYPCQDSFVAEIYNPSTKLTKIKYGKRPGAPTCDPVQPEAFNHSGCARGPDNKMCYSSINTRTDTDICEITENNLSVCYYNNSLEAHIMIWDEDQYHSIVLPSDYTKTLLPGKYWIGDAPAGDFLISDIDIKINKDSIEFNKFVSGYLEVIKSGQVYQISYEFRACESSLYSGFYRGPIL